MNGRRAFAWAIIAALLLVLVLVLAPVTIAHPIAMAVYGGIIAAGVAGSWAMDTLRGQS